MTGDLATGEGVEAAVEGAETIVHLAGSSKGDGEKAANLVQAAVEAGTRHLVYISVVGADRVPVVSGADRAMFGYYAAKHAGERAVAESGMPWTTLRATQFHDLMLLTARQMAKLPVIPAPSGFQAQPVDADEVAARLVELALGAPAGLVDDLAGPRVYPLADLIRGYLRPAASTARSCRFACPARPPARCARARTWPPIAPSGGGRGRSSSRRGRQDHGHGRPIRERLADGVARRDEGP